MELKLPGLRRPLADVAVVEDPMDQAVTAERYARAVIPGLRSAGFSLTDRTSVALPNGDAVRLEFRATRIGRLIVYTFAEPGRGVSLFFSLGRDPASERLLEPTVAAVAGTVELSG
jgi:hypothetical protein